jgi:hypothetical protein
VSTRTCIAAACVAGGVIALPAAPAQAASPCSGKGAQGYASSAGARVFALPSKGKFRPIYACLFSQDKRRLLGYDGTCGDHVLVRSFRLVGPYVAYGARTCFADYSREKVVVRNIKTGKVVRQAPVTAGLEKFPKPTDYLISLELAASGAVVWTGQVDGDSGEGSQIPADVDDTQVRKLGPGSPASGELVDSGLAIDPYSLALARRQGSANRFYWQKGDTPSTGLLAASAGVSKQSVSGQSASKCTGKGAKTIAAAAGRFVFTLPAAGGERKVYACLVSKNKRTFLGWYQECQNQTAVSTFRFAGALLAYVETTCGLVSGDDRVVKRRLDTGEVVRYGSAATGTTSPGSESTTTVTDLEIAATGNMVWIGEFDADGSGGIGNVPGDDRQVRKFDGAESAVTVDSGIGIEPGSLALGRYQGYNRFFWMKSGLPFSAVFKAN